MTYSPRERLEIQPGLPPEAINAAYTDALFTEALAHHEAGRIEQAEAGYQTILQHAPDHPDSLHLTGLIAVQRGDPVAGAALIERSIRLAPGRAPPHNNLALAYYLMGRIEDAVLEYRTAASLRPESGEIHNDLATALRDLGRHEEAVGHYRLALERAPAIAEIWYNLANALADRAGPLDVEPCYRRALELAPNFAHAHANYGRWLMTQARWTEAEAHLSEALRVGTPQPAVWNNLGIALQELARARDAQTCYRRAVELDPGFAPAHYNLGCLLSEDGRTDEAIASHAAALAADPLNGAARLARCMAQLPILYRTQEEVADRRKRYAAALTGLAASARSPAIADALAAAIGTAQPFFLPYQEEDDRALQTTYGRLACALLARTTPPLPASSWPNTRRVRIGIVSGFFRDHTIFKLFLESWLTQLDRGRFEVTAFHTGGLSDEITAQAADWSDRFVHGLPTADAWRDAVLKTRPDVMLYPEIGMDPIAGRLAAQRLAPVQCVAWGQPETTGMPTIDYFLSSDLMEPPDAEAHYTETLVRLPNLGLCYLPDPPPATPLDRAALGLHQSAPVFWSGQALYKYLPQYDSLFPRIAAALGECQFVFIGFARSRAVTTAFYDRLQTAFSAVGMAAQRHCVILPPMPQDRYVAAAELADVVLDTPGWSGGKSTLDGLIHNPAIVTLPGRFMRGRHTAAILRRMGCEATIADSPDSYVSIATRLAADPAWRRTQRQAVALGKHRVYRDLGCIRALEAFLTEALERASGRARRLDEAVHEAELGHDHR